MVSQGPQVVAEQRSTMSRLGRFVPGVSVVGDYKRSWFRPDLLAGVTVWAMLVLQALGYSTLAGAGGAAASQSGG